MRQKNAFATTVGSKILIALTGLALFAYLILHLAGNLLILFGPKTYNGYSHFLISNPLIYPIELALLAIFFLHIYKTVTMWIANKQARPVPYVKKKMAGPPSRKSVASSTMIYTGLFLLLFVIVHLKGFKYGAYYEVTGENHVRDLYRTEIEQFHNPVIVAFYVVSMVLIGFHLWHGFWSASQSLGLDNPKLSRQLLTASKALSVLICGGFIGVTLWVFLIGGR